MPRGGPTVQISAYVLREDLPLVRELAGEEGVSAWLRGLVVSAIREERRERVIRENLEEWSRKSPR